MHLVTAADKLVPLVFFRTDSGSEPVREWLLELPKADRHIIKKTQQTLESDLKLARRRKRQLGEKK